MAETLTVDDFAGHLDEPFAIDLGTDFPGLEPLVLTLIKAVPIETDQDLGERRAPFSVVFRGPVEPELPQRFYPLDCETLGHLGIFLGPGAGRGRLGNGPRETHVGIGKVFDSIG